MGDVTILYPALCMFLLTMGNIFYMGFSRYRAIQQRDVNIRYYRTYNEGEQTPRLHLIGRHVQNHFEVPPLFYIGVIIAYIANGVSSIAIAFAWLYFAARVVHSFIHLGSNNVSVRFFTFGFSLLCLMGLWLSVFYRLSL